MRGLIKYRNLYTHGLAPEATKCHLAARAKKIISLEESKKNAANYDCISLQI